MATPIVAGTAAMVRQYFVQASVPACPTRTVLNYSPLTLEPRTDGDDTPQPRVP